MAESPFALQAQQAAKNVVLGDTYTLQNQECVQVQLMKQMKCYVLNQCLLT